MGRRRSAAEQPANADQEVTAMFGTLSRHHGRGSAAATTSVSRRPRPGVSRRCDYGSAAAAAAVAALAPGRLALLLLLLATQLLGTLAQELLDLAVIAPGVAPRGGGRRRRLRCAAFALDAYIAAARRRGRLVVP
jgi:hypothetical protein